MMETAIDAIRRGGLVVVTDDTDRENEGDLVIAADAVTPEAIAFMAVHGRGLVCVAMEPHRLDALELGPMVPGGSSETNFTVSIDLDVPGSTGISAADRAATIRRAVDANSVPSEFRRPGHVFPLRYTPGGVLARRGHTEASVDLARLAGRTPAGVICEILNDDGTMARGAVLRSFAEWHGLPMVSVADIADYLRDRPHWADQSAVTGGAVRLAAETVLPSRYGDWRTFGFRGGDGLEYVVLMRGELGGEEPMLVRLHSECLTGDALGSARCDCGEQLQMSMRQVADEGTGAIIYVRGHEGRGIGLLPKLRAYALQDQGLDTVDANLALGYRDDSREYAGAAAVLKTLGIEQIRLLTNNAVKVTGMRDNGIDVVERIPLITTPSADNLRYLWTKQTRMGHQLDTDGTAGPVDSHLTPSQPQVEARQHRPQGDAVSLEGRA
ncbi:3,4-dihydroxy 2-butanone 4-phosphate synthase/GTP cyclohydrolase II [Mycobacterium sp. MAA66]|uniref:GTP cyclohydrolase II n=1 Tax=Mycobacterium sp. MAA66 TaxID=3156297 RepID=UPI0035145C18